MNKIEEIKTEIKLLIDSLETIDELRYYSIKIQLLLQELEKLVYKSTG